MALPWLIGAAIVGAVGVIAKAVSEDSPSTSNSNGSNEAEERRRREAAEEKRRQEDIQARRKDARISFKQQGDAIGRNLVDALEKSVEVTPANDQFFKVTLAATGYKLSLVHESDAKPIENLLRLSLDDDKDLDLVIQNLDFFGAVYDVRMQSTPALNRQLGSLNALIHQQQELDQLRRDIAALGKLKTANPIESEA